MDRWTVARATHDGHPLLIRFQQFEASFPRRAFPERLDVFWAMSRPDANGLASDEEAERLGRFEDALVALLEDEGEGTLAAVLTCDGKREFVFQVRDVARFLEMLHRLPADGGPFPVQIQHHSDPEWEYFYSVIEDVR